MKIKHCLAAFGAASLCFNSALICCANSVTNAPLTGESNTNSTRITVTASPITQYEQTARDGASSAVIGREQLERLNATDLPTALRQVPGVTISRYSPIGAYGGAQGGSVYIRGAGTARPGSEIKMYTAGVPRESGVWAHPLMDIVPIDFAESVTVARNPQPQNYPGTFGAVDMELRRRREEGHEAEMSAAYGRFNTILGSVSVGGRMDIFDYYAGAAYKHSEGARSHSEADLHSVYANPGWSLSEHDRLSYLYFHTDNWVRDPGPRGGPKPQRDKFETTTHTHSLRLDSVRDHLKGYALLYYDEGKIRWHKDHLSDDNYRSPPGYSNTDWYNFGFRSLYDIIFDALIFTLSVDTWSEGGSTRNINELSKRKVWGYSGRFYTTAPYAGVRYEFDLGSDWTLTPSVGSRYYINNEFDNEWAPCSALTLAQDGMSFYISHARGVNYPGIYARGTSPKTWRSLDAEVMDTYEVGTHLEVVEWAALHAALFRSEIDDRMDMSSEGYKNTGSVNANGAELSAHFYPTKDLTFFAGTTFTDPRTKPVSRMPEFTASAGVSYQIVEHLRWDFDTEYVAHQYAYSMRGKPDLRKLDGYLLFNTRISLDMRAMAPLDGEIYLALENISNEHHEYFPGYHMPGMLWYTGMKLKF